jgi:glycosyltransferase involved in cell wall biosynthesis
MNVLHITNKPIFPILDGGQMAMYKLMKNFLQLGFNVKNLTLETYKHPFNINDYPEDLQDIINPEAHYIDSRVKSWDVFLSLFKKESYHVKRFVDSEFELKIKELLQTNNFEYVILESAFLMSYINVIRKYSDAKIILRAHNVEYRIWRQHARKEKSFLKRYFYKKLSKDLKRFELTFINLVDGVFCISEQDREFFRRRAVKTPTVVIPVYMDLVEDNMVNYENNDFHFVGSMSWKPNADAVKWIINQIAPKLQRLLPDSKIHIAGSAMPKSMKEKQIKNVVFHGKVNSMCDFMSTHGTLIVPLKTGSGVRIKILEALSFGVPLISTEKGKEGISLTPKKHFLTANITEEFLLQMKYLNENTMKKKSLGEEGKKFISEEYSIEIVSNHIREFLAKI